MRNTWYRRIKSSWRWLLLVTLSAATVASVTRMRGGVGHATATSGTNWTAVAPMPTARALLGAATGPDGRIYAIGGENSCSNGVCNVLATVEAYTPSTDSWSTVASLPIARSGLVAATGGDGRIYALAGYDGHHSVTTVEAYAPATNSWSTVAPMPTAWPGFTAAAGRDGRIYAMGGDVSGSTGSTSLEVYDPASNTWACSTDVTVSSGCATKTLAPLPGADAAWAAASGPDGRIYAMGGCLPSHLCPFNIVEVYSPSTNTWTSSASGTAPALPTARSNLAAVRAADGRIYAIGGDSACCSPSSTVEAYNASTNTWDSVDQLATGSADLAAAVGVDGRIYTLGGEDKSGFLNTVEAYTPGSNAWDSRSPLSTPRYDLAAASGADGRIYAIGGVDNNGNRLNSVSAYSPGTDTWDDTVAALPVKRSALAAATGADGRIYTVGGRTGTGLTKNVEAYTSSTNSWSSVATMPTAREYLAAATGLDGRIYALGGDSGSMFSPLNTVEVYTPSTNSWATLPPMPTRRTRLAAATGADGRIYAIGGFNGNNAVATVEAYDPRSNSWTGAAPLPTSTAFLAAAAGRDGRIYTFGGYLGSYAPQATVFAYTPATNAWVTVAPLLTARFELAAAAGLDGRIYAIGGTPNGGTMPTTLTTAEAYTPPPPSEWYFAEGNTSSGYEEYLTLANPGPVTANVTVTYVLSDANPVTKTYQVGPSARVSEYVNSEVGAGHGVSMVVNSDQPVIVERQTYFLYTFPNGYRIPGGTVALGAAGLSNDFAFAYLDTTAGHDTYLAILNASSSQMTATVQYFPADGSTPITTTHSVPANRQARLYVNQEGLPAGTYSALITLSQPGLVERRLYMTDGTSGNTGAGDTAGTPGPLTNWYFADGYTCTNYNERFYIANPGASTAHAILMLYRPDGSTATTTVTLPPGQQQLVNANGVLGSKGGANSARVSSDVPILAERVIALSSVLAFPMNNGCQTWRILPLTTDGMGNSALGTIFHFAVGAVNNQSSEYLTLENPSQALIAYVTVIYRPANGATPVVQVYLVSPHSRQTVYIDNVMPSQSFSMVVQSTVPIAAERALQFTYMDPSGNMIPGGSDVVGYLP